MHLLYATSNPAKLSAMQSRLSGLNIELISLKDMAEQGFTIPKVSENGSTPLENARQKANAYYDAFHIPVFSCDSGLYFDNVPDEVQPGVHVRTVNGRELDDDENRIYEAMESSMESEKFIITDKPHSTIRKKGFPLDSLSIDIKTGKYYYDLPTEDLEQVAVEDGFLEFFRGILNCE